jgi:hypothetical protein
MGRICGGADFAVAMFRFIGLCFGTLIRLLRARRSLLLENLALCQQLAVLKRRRPRPRLDLFDKLFWAATFVDFGPDGSSPSLRSRPKRWCVGTGADSVCTGS